MPIKKPRSKVKLHIGQIEGQGVDIQKVLGGLSNMKTELEGLGCQVSIKVQGVELAGNETRTRDILLGNNSVTPTREAELLTLEESCPCYGAVLGFDEMESERCFACGCKEAFEE